MSIHYKKGLVISIDFTTDWYVQVSFISKYYGFLKNQFVVKQIKTNVQKLSI